MTGLLRAATGAAARLASVPAGPATGRILPSVTPGPVAATATTPAIPQALQRLLQLPGACSRSTATPYLHSFLPAPAPDAASVPGPATTSATASASLSLRSLMEAGMHLGHAPSKLHKNMLPFVYGER
jgi:hypothetical protein